MSPYDKTLFQGTAWYYARYRKPYPQILFSLLRKQFSLDGTDRLLDLGAGTGELSLPLGRDFEGITAVEPDPEMITEGKRRAAEAGVGNIMWANMTAEAFEGRPRSFRLVTIGAALHWMDKDKVLAKVHELLVPGGGLAVVSSKSVWTSEGKWQRAVVEVEEVPRRRAAGGEGNVCPGSAALRGRSCGTLLPEDRRARDQGSSAMDHRSDHRSSLLHIVCPPRTLWR